MSIARINTFRAKDGRADELREFLVSITPIVRQSQGCESCQLLESQEDPTVFVVIEAWLSVAAHQAAVKDIPAEMRAAGMAMLASPPSGSYYAASAGSLDSRFRAPSGARA